MGRTVIGQEERGGDRRPAEAAPGLAVPLTGAVVRKGDATLAGGAAGGIEVPTQSGTHP